MTQPRQMAHSGTGRVSETRFSLLEQRVGGIETSLATMSSKLDVWMAGRSQSSWKIVGFIAAILIPLAFIVNLYITSAISPWAAIANQAKATADANSIVNARLTEDMGTVKAQNADSKRDRDDKGKAIDAIINVQTDLLKTMAREQSLRVAHEREIETQFDADSQLRNVQWATIMRKQAELQNALHESGAKMPAVIDGPFYFPNISNRKSIEEQP